jgi:ParB family transcriptional regulator, chromosome partitioning protein
VTQAPKKRGLGRGLDALLRPAGGDVRSLPVGQLHPNRFQPRRDFEPAALAELATSIRAQGLVQPIVVTPEHDGSYTIVAGERRWRAAQEAGLEQVPVVVREVRDDRHLLELALVENLQRADLGPMEEAHAFQALLDEFELTHDAIAQRLGRAKSTISNALRLLDLHPDVQAAIADGRLTAGHARAILGLPTSQHAHVAKTVIDQGFSVRQAEELVRRLREPRPAPAAREGLPDPDLERVEDDLRQRLGTKVTLARSRRGGRIIIEFYSDEELSQLYDRLIGGPA